MPRDPILAGMKLLDQLKRKNNNNVSTSSSSSHLSKSCSSRRVAKTTPSTGIVRGHAPVRRQREDTINEAINTIQTITQAAKARRQVVEQAASVFPRIRAPVLVKEANSNRAVDGAEFLPAYEYKQQKAEHARMAFILACSAFCCLYS